MHVSHTAAPDGSLYATVNKPRRESTPKHAPAPTNTATIPNGGATVLQNGPLNHSADSGISSSAGYPGSGPSSGSQTRSPAMSSTVAQTPPRPPVDQQTQLDELLNDLLSDTLFKDPTGTLDRTLERRSDKDLAVPSHGSLTTHSGNSRTIVSWDTAQSGPSRSVTVTKETSSKPSPNTRVETVTKQTEEVSYGKNPYGKSQVMNGSIARDDLDRSFGSSVHESRTFDSRASTMTREGLSPPAPPPRDMTKSPIYRDQIASPTLREGVQSPPTNYNPTSPTPPARYQHLPYRVDYDNQDMHTDSYNMSQYRGYASDSEEPLSWLEKQQEKLQAKRDGRSWRNRSERERALVSELRSAQNTMLHRRVQSDVEDAVSERVEREKKPAVYAKQEPFSYASGRRQMSPEPMRKAMTPDPIRRSHSVQGDNYKAERSYFVSGVERPPFTTHQTKYTFSVSPPKPANAQMNGDAFNVASKPPPSPSLGRSSAPNSPIVPQRGTSSRDAVRTRTLTRDTNAGYSPKLDELERNLQAALQAPNQSAPPRRSANSGYESDDISRSTNYQHESRQTAEQSYETQTRQMFSYQTKTSQEKRAAAKAKKTGANRRLFSPITTLTKVKVEPEEEEVIEEDVISLQPIGVGVHELEPNATLPRSTTPRATTPSFPVQVVTTPPFPTTPKTPYENKGTTSPLSATLPPKQTAPMTQQPQHHSATVSRQQHSTQQHVQQQNYQQFSSPQQASNQNAAPQFNAQPSPVVGVGGNEISQVHGGTALQTAPGGYPQGVSPPEYSTLQRDQQVQQQQQSYSVQQSVQKQYSTAPQTSPGGSMVPGGQTITQQNVQRSYTQSGTPHGDGGVQQREEYSTRSVQYGVDGSHGGMVGTPQPGAVQNYQTGTQQDNFQQRQDQIQQQRIQQQQQQHVQQQHVQQQHVQQQHVQQQQNVQQAQQQQLQQQQQQLQQQQQIQQQQREQQFHQQQQQQEAFNQQQQQQREQQFHQQQQQQEAFNQQQQQQFHQQHQTSSTAAHHQQQFGHQGGAVHNGTLHVDTTLRGGTMPRSPSSAGSGGIHSPPSPGSVQMIRSQLAQGGTMTPGAHSMTGQSSPSVYFGQSRRGSLTSLGEGGEIVHHTPKFVRDTSKYWYKPHISREEAITLLKDKQPGTFVVRDSNSFPGAFGLALKVAQVPPNVQTKGGDPLAELVRHFLIEPTPKGVKLKGCSNEPVFGSLAALVYQHSITPLALPCKLLLPETATNAELAMIYKTDPAGAEDTVDAKKDSVSTSTIMTQGAACNVLYLNSVDMESLTGREAVAKAIKDSFTVLPPVAKITVVHFKVSSQGITLTDNKRKLFFRRHYPLNTVTYCGMDPEDRRWKEKAEEQGPQLNAKLFGFVARKPGSNSENACHIFAEIDPDQPAHAIVSFVAKVMTGQGQFMR